MKHPNRRHILVWLVVLGIAAVILARATWLTDMSVFLPSAPTPEQKLLISNLQRGQSARTLLASAGPFPAARLKAVSTTLTTSWRSLDGIASVSNGTISDFDTERKLLADRRYLLTGNGVDDPFSEANLRDALIRARSLLASSAGLFNKDLILGDPTGAGLQSLAQLSGSSGPARQQGVWVDGSGSNLLFLITLDISGADLDRQEELLAQVREQYAQAVRPGDPTLAEPSLTLSGAPVFAVQSRDEIRSDVVRLSSIGMGLIIILLLTMFRSPRILLIALLPLVTAVATGAAAVALGFGSIHAMTLGFGVALIGECVDYALYHLVHQQSGAGRQDQFWAPIRLGLMTSLVGFAALLFSDFPGLSQLAVLAMAGLSAGFLTTRYVLPALPVPNARLNHFYGLEARLRRAAASLVSWRLPAAIVVIACVLTGVVRRDALWSTDIAALNPVSAQAMQIDTIMREALGGPDVNNMVLVSANEPGGDVLEATAAVTQALRSLVQNGQLRGVQSPVDMVPPRSLQKARQALLPDEATLRARITAVADTTGLSAKALTPFIQAVTAARSETLITAADYAGTRLEGRLDAMLSTIDGRAVAVITLDHDPSATPDSARLEAQLQQQLAGSPAMRNSQLTVLNLKAKTDALYGGYIRDALSLSLTGAAAIIILLAFSLRNWRTLGKVCLPIGGTLAIIVAGFALSGSPLHLLHLVGLLLVAAIGSNYALVLARPDAATDADELTLTPLVLANLTTLAGFGVLAFSHIPLLAALGLTVGIGAPLVLVLAAIVNARPLEPGR